jgi:hypothetical protein
MRKYIILGLMVMGGCLSGSASEEVGDSSKVAVVTSPFWDNWYGQVGLDMTLLFPVDHNIKDVFPNGKAFGINMAAGKWFSPEFGGRLKVGWRNGILKNEGATWYKPYGVPGQNQRNGGFVTFIGDIELNLHNLFGEYKADRKWNLIATTRAGGWVDVGSGKGASLLGFGLINTYRMGRNWSLFADVGFHFLTSINGTVSGKESNSNTFADINIGVELDLGKRGFEKNVKMQKFKNAKIDKREEVYIPGFWSNWFVQAGLGMTLHNPYGTNFGNVFPNGSTYGINLAAGKWFTPEAGVRAGLNWQNSIIMNHSASYLAPKEDPDGDLDRKGTIALYADLFFNLHNAIAGYDEDRKWNAIVFPRMGLAENFSSTYKECPILGIGTEQTYKINDRIKLFADLVYQVVTSGYYDTRFKTGEEGGSSNGWFDLNVGVQIELGTSCGKFTKR